MAERVAKQREQIKQRLGELNLPVLGRLLLNYVLSYVMYHVASRASAVSKSPNSNVALRRALVASLTDVLLTPLVLCL